MAGKTFLQIVNDVERELGLTQSPTVFGDTGTTTGKQLGSLANRVVDEFRRMNRWTALQIEYDLLVNPPISTTGDLAAGDNKITGLPGTTGIVPDAFMAAGDGVPSAARITSVDSASQVTLSMYNTNDTNLTGTDILFMQDTYPMPPGFDWFINRTMWDRTNRWELLGPDSPQQDQWQRSGIVPLTPRRHFRKIGPFSRAFRLWPPPAELIAPLQLVFEYQTTHSVMVHGDVCELAIEYVNDDDVCVLDDQAIILGMKWMFWEIKGFGSYVTMQTRWLDYCDRLIGRDGAAPTLNLAPIRQELFISPAQVQDGNFPGPSE
jgi:hypothetical protein